LAEAEKQVTSKWLDIKAEVAGVIFEVPVLELALHFLVLMYKVASPYLST
jgi:hypothetical protein